jgi:hypothetical protein
MTRNRLRGIIRRVEGEYREMPGLQLTLAQASRLWSLDRETCRDVLQELAASGFLQATADGRYRRVSDGPERRMARAELRPAVKHRTGAA